ncbi:MAG: hemolysin family protein [Oscillospiraceae bacterium]|nr:hemolysin family protein [Oscillospiraceae bacterium]
MDGGSWLQVLIFIALMMIGAYFGAAESSFSAMNKIRIKNLADEGDKRAKNAMFISSNFDRALTTLLVGNNITHIACASIATVVAMRLLENKSSNPGLSATIITTVAVYLFCEMIPKSYANSHSEKLSLAYSGSLRFLMKLFYPLVFFFTLITKWFSKLFNKKQEPTITEDELYDIIENIEEEGTMDEDQSDLFKSALEYTKTSVGDVMTMREDISAVDITSSYSDILSLVKSVKYSRIPVFEGNIDKIIGILQIRAFLKAYLSGAPFDIHDMLTEPNFLTKSELIDDALRDMSRHKIYLSIVRDDSGRTLGLVTIEDFLEELVGEIWDEDDVVDDDFFKLGGNRFDVGGHITLGEALRRMGCFEIIEKMKSNSQERLMLNKSVQAFVLENFGHIPEVDESFVYADFEFTVEQMDINRILKVIIKHNTGEPHEEDDK